MKSLQIVEHKRNEIVGFKGGNGPVGNLSQEALVELAILAKDSGDANLLGLFESLPDVADLRKAKAKAGIAAIENEPEPAAPAAATPPVITGSGNRSSNAGLPIPQDFGPAAGAQEPTPAAELPAGTGAVSSATSTDQGAGSSAGSSTASGSEAGTGTSSAPGSAAATQGGRSSTAK